MAAAFLLIFLTFGVVDRVYYRFYCKELTSYYLDELHLCCCCGTSLFQGVLGLVLCAVSVKRFRIIVVTMSCIRIFILITFFLGSIGYILIPSSNTKCYYKRMKDID